MSVCCPAGGAVGDHVRYWSDVKVKGQAVSQNCHRTGISPPAGRNTHRSLHRTQRLAKGFSKENGQKAERETRDGRAFLGTGGGEGWRPADIERWVQAVGSLSSKYSKGRTRITVNSIAASFLPVARSVGDSS